MSNARAISPVSSFRLGTAYLLTIATGLLKLTDQHGGLLFHRSWLSILACFFFAVVIVIYVFVFVFSGLTLSICNFSEIELMTSEDYLDIAL